MRKVLFMHSGSANHGCEAIIRSTSALLGGPENVWLWSLSKEEDVRYGADAGFERIVESEQIERFSPAYFEALIRRKILRQPDANLNVFIRETFRDAAAISIGGDNYCYKWSANQAVSLNRQIRQVCRCSVLWGCSVDEQAITDEVARDLAQYDLITAREGITYESLKKINPRTVQVADPAFLLEKTEKALPPEFIEGNTVGVNVSPLIMDYTNDSRLVMENYVRLIEYILTQTNMNICLVPHVVWSYNNDLGPIQRLYEMFRHTKRICVLEDCNAMELKGYIARCRFFVGARTHATIAAYSSCVPTLVVGYSVKSRGIARDLFGTDERYVLPVQGLASGEQLKNGFEWLMKQESNVKKTLSDVLPMYLGRAKKAAAELEELAKR